MQLNDPVSQESVTAGDGDCHTAPDGRFNPSPLSRMQIGFLSQSLARDQRRRCVYRAGHLRVRVDGEEWRQCDPEADLSEPFNVPLTASYLEIFGDDPDGALLLAVFPLPEPASIEGGQAQHLWMALEGGQAVGAEISLGIGAFGVVSEYVIKLAYSESAGGPCEVARNLRPRP